MGFESRLWRIPEEKGRRCPISEQLLVRSPSGKFKHEDSSTFDVYNRAMGPRR